jgi:hypothetical protein
LERGGGFPRLYADTISPANTAPDNGLAPGCFVYRFVVWASGFPAKEKSLGFWRNLKKTRLKFAETLALFSVF